MFAPKIRSFFRGRTMARAYGGMTLTSKPAQDNTKNFKIIESTLREGEQFSTAHFDRNQKTNIVRMLDDIGVDYIELTSPVSSPESFADAKFLATLPNRKVKLLTHIRCHIDDAKAAVETGVDGVDLVFGTSAQLREHSHGKDIDYIIEQATKVITYVKSQGVEVRFSTEDSFRSELVDLLAIYSVADKLGVDRVGVADTVGVANPLQVYDLIKLLKSVVNADIEFHGHNDTGCAIANSFMALKGGAKYIDTSVLGIGERNGITSLGGLLARMYTIDPEGVKKKYNLPLVDKLEKYVAEVVEIDVPFNNFITGSSAFTHKAGIHSKAVLQNPSTYECINPADWGVTRNVPINHRLTGWNSVKDRGLSLGLLNLSDADFKEITQVIKSAADTNRNLSVEEVDAILEKANHDKIEKLERAKATKL